MRHMINEYKSLAYLKGQKLDVVSSSLWVEHQPEYAIFLEDYPNTILIDLVYVKSYWDPRVGERHIKKMLTKAELATIKGKV